MNKVQYVVQNTCASDTVTQCIATIYCDSDVVYKEFNDKCVENEFINYIKSLVTTNKTGQNIYVERLQLHLTLIMMPDSSSEVHVVNCAANVALAKRGFVIYRNKDL